MMMVDLAMHISDVGMNAIEAKASELLIELHSEADSLTLSFHDNGVGMSPEVLAKACTPQFTTRTTRKYGLGLSLLKASALQCEGTFAIDSTQGVGTHICARFSKKSWDLPPLGNIGQAIVLLMDVSSCNIRFVYHNQTHRFVFDKAEILQQLGVEQIEDWATKEYLMDYLNQHVH
ncbi:MAG: ATP-binding protein [Erysipelotrichaceae bacterium]